MVAYASDSSLNLLKEPSEATLQQLQQTLERYLEDTEETAPLTQLASSAGQMHGVFTMLEEPQAAALMRELETVSQQLVDGTVTEPVSAQEALLDAVLQAPRYFEWLQQNNGQQSFDLQPLISQLQIARGEPTAMTVAPVAAAEIRPALRDLAARLRPVLQRALLEVLRGQTAALEQIGQVCGRLKSAASDETTYRLCWLVEGLAADTLANKHELSRDFKLLLRDVDQYVKQLQDGAKPYQLNEQSEQLDSRLKQTLAANPSGVAWLQQKSDYQPPRGVSVALGPIITPQLADNKALLTVVELLQESILISQDSFDRFARDRSRNELLEGQVKRLQDIVNILTLLDLTVPAKLLQKHLTELSQWTDGSEPAANDAIFQAACDLVLVKSCLDSLGENVYSQEMAALRTEGDDTRSAELLQRLELRRARKLIAEESRGFIDKAWTIAASHVASGEIPSWDELTPILHRVGGTLTMLECVQAQHLTGRLYAVVASLASDSNKADSARVLSGFADVIVSLEHYLSLLVNHDQPNVAVLSHAEKELVGLEAQCGITSPPAMIFEPVIDDKAKTKTAEVAKPLIEHPFSEPKRLLSSDSDFFAKTESFAATERDTSDSSEVSDFADGLGFSTFSEATKNDSDDASDFADGLDFSAFSETAESSSASSDAVTAFESSEDSTGFEFNFDLDDASETLPGLTATDIAADDALSLELSGLALDPMTSMDSLDSAAASVMVESDPVPLNPAIDNANAASVEEEDPLDAEIREIFAEEARGEVASIGENLILWRANLADRDAQSTIRRSFHTLKGSGRMVGQNELGDFAWSFEQLMNRMLDGQLTPDQSSLAVVADARQFLQGIVHDINHFDTSDPALITLAERAEALMSGQPVAAETMVEPTAALATEDSNPEEIETTLDEVALEAFAFSDASEANSLEPLSTEFAGSEDSAEPLEEASEESTWLDKFSQKAEFTLNESMLNPADVDASLEQLTPEFAISDTEPLADEPFRRAQPAKPFTPVVVEQARGAEPDSVPAELDPELLEALLEEAGEILDTSDSTLQRWSADPDNYELLNDLRRDLHTLKGGSRMAGFMTIGDLAHAMESVLEAISRGELAATAAPTEALQKTLDRLSRMFNQVRHNQAIEPASGLIDELNQVLGTEAAAPQAAAEAAGSDFADAFLDEAWEILASSDITLSRWSQALGNREMLEDLRRDVHTLNGNAQMAKSESISHLAGATAGLLDAVAKEQLPPSAEIIDILQQSLDGLNANLGRLKEQAEPAPVDNIINQIKGLLGQEATATTIKTAAIALPKTAKASPVLAVVKPAAAKKPAAATDTIRVDSKLLNSLTNQIGESSIYRARVEQGVNGFRFNLGELEQTVNRLRQQLRRLEIETESQILFRHDDGRDHGPEFDPLELDRFSELQQVSRSLMEIIDDLSNVQNTMEDQAQNLNSLLYQQSKVNKDVQENLMRTRMVQFSSAAPRLRRVVRQVAQELGKKVEFVLHGNEAEIDRTVLDNMIAPLEHMLRNAVFHGIETPKNRRASDKPESGRIELALRREGAELVLELSDDGAGLNYAAIRSKGEELGWIKPGQAATEQDLIALMLQPGFSTAKEVSQTAGRGVGMDVLNDAIKGMRGALQIQSESGLGSRFTIRLPFSLAVTQALLVQAGGNSYAIPLLSIEAVDRIDEEELKTYLAGDTVEHEYGQHEYPIYSMGVLFGSEPVPFEDVEDTAPPALLFRSAEASAALQVDAVLGSQEIIVKPLAPQLLGVPGISGATMLGDGSVVIVLELAALVRNIGTQHAKYEAMFEALQARQEKEVTHLTAMVIDDSITMRKITTRLLQRHDVDVTTAKDGVEAVALLEDITPSMIILDIEMPRMDGFEVLAHIRNQARLQQVPVIMVTSRSGDKHRARAAKLGVSDYLIKPYQDEEMMRSVRKVLNPDDLVLLN